MDKKIGKKAIVASVFLAMLLLLSAAGLTTLAANTDTATLLIEIESDEQLQRLRDDGLLLVDYNNGMALIEVPKAQLNAYRDAYDTNMDESRYEIDLWNSGHVIDRRQGMPELPTELRTDDLSGVKPYVVQFIGPLPSQEWKQQVMDAGAVIQGDLGNYAVLVRMDTVSRNRVEKLDIVAWTGVYHPAFKIQNGLLEREGAIQVSFIPWSDVSLRELESALVDFGVTTGRSDGVGITGAIDVANLPALASLPEVYAINAYSLPQTLDNMANQIQEVQSLWYTSWSGLPERITGYTQIIGMQDTGFDIGNPDDGHPDFFNGPLGDRIVRYEDRTGYSDPDGETATVAHGTHCAGLVMGNGWSWRTHIGAPDPDVDTSYHLGEATGAAPESKMSIDGVSGERGGLAADITYMNDQEADGARTFTNSWGMPDAYGYDGTSAELDNMLDGGMTHADENVILFAAGNDGPEEGTVGREANAKNVISVGASENYRPEWHSAENPGNVIDFSGRGGNIDGGRIAPDILSVGTAQISAFGIGEWNYYESSGQGVPQPGWFQEVDEYDYTIPGPGSDGRADYQYMQGTSMAAPQAAGMVALTREYYRLIHGMEDANPPSNPLTRATLINGADRMNPMFPYPGYDQGWGRLNLKNSLYPDAPQSNQFAEGTFSATGTMDLAADLGFNLNVKSGDVPLKATLVWVDSSGETLNRKLHLTATDPEGATYQSGVDNYNSDGWMIPDSNNLDTTNYVQRIEIEAPVNGTWSFTVHATEIPSAANFAIVMSADFGPQDTYDVDLQTDYPTTISLVAGGNTNLPVEVRNWGTNSDTIELTDTSPGGITLTYSPSATLALESEEQQLVDVKMQADAGLAADVYKFEITGTSTGDPNAQDTIRITIQVLDQKLPYKEIAAGDAQDERWADVITFEDASGTPWIFVAYLMGTVDGDRVFVKYSQLGTDGKPISWSSPVNVDVGDGQLEYPGWTQLQHVRGGLQQDRVLVHWLGRDPNDIEKTPAYVSWADSGSYGTWSAPVEMDYNEGSSTNNVKRAVYMLWRDDGTDYGELTYVFEHLDNDGTNVVGIGIAYTISADGGATWANAAGVPGADGSDGYYYFFPNGITDQNEVNWHFFYYRASDGNTRVVVTKLQEGDSWGESVEIMGDLALTNHNWQFPAAAHANEGGTNTIYVSAIYDNGGAGQDVSTGYIQGYYDSANPPPEFTTGDNVMGGYVTESGYMESFVLSMTTSYDDTDGWYAWTGYQETDTAFDVPNLDAGKSSDHYATVSVDYVTRDNYAKLNPQMSSLAIDDGAGGSNHYVYMSYHASYGTITEVDYQIYLAVFHAGFKTDPDTEGPNAYGVSADPNPVNLGEASPTIDIIATIDDTDTGFSGIGGAEYLITDVDYTNDKTAIPWGTDGTYMTVSGTSQIETASVVDVDVSWLESKDYYVWVRGQDEHGNWGDEHAGYTLLKTEVDAAPPSIELTYPTGGETFNAFDEITITWSTTAGDGIITGVDIYYSTDGGASYTEIVTGTTDDGSHTWIVPDEHTSEARIRVTVKDDNGLSDTDYSANFDIIGTPPEPPTGLDVVHSGTAGTQEMVENGLFVDDYDPWILEILQGSQAGWTGDASYEDGGSIYVYSTQEGAGVSHEEAYWEQSIGPITGEMAVSAAFLKDTLVTTGGPGNNQAGSVNTATVRIDVWDTGTGAWETVLENTGTSSYPWTLMEGTYTPVTEVNAVRAYMYAETEGDDGQTGQNTWSVGAECTLLMDAVSIETEGSGTGDDDNLITWDASTDDPDKVTHYHIYRNETETGTYELIATISAAGSVNYSYIDSGKGTADEIYWWYQVYSDTNGQYSDTAAGPVQEPGGNATSDTFAISLVSGGDAAGWNFVSFNIELTDTTLETILADIDGSYDKVMYYDASAGEWSSYVPGRAEHFNNLATWDHRMGLWIHATVDDTLTVEGTAPTSTDITLYPGWNMVGLPSSTTGNHGLPAEVSRIGYFSATATYNMAYNYDPATFEFSPGQGYMVYLDHTEPVTWTVTY